MLNQEFSVTVQNESFVGELTGSTMNFNALLDLYLVQKRYCVKESTYAHYCNLINRHIRNELGNYMLKELSSCEIERFTDNLLKNGKANGGRGLSPKTVKDILTIIKSALKYGVSKGWVGSCVIAFSMPRITKNNVEVLSREEQKLLETQTAFADNLHFGIYLCLYTGMRIGEICALQWKDIDLENSTINISKTIQRIYDYADGDAEVKTKVVIDLPKSASSERRIPIPSTLNRQLKVRRGECSEEDYFLTSNEHYIEPRSYYAKYKAAMKKYGLGHYNFHALRHTFATRCIEIGFDPKVLSEILGHSDVKITLDRYVHPSMDRKRACMELLFVG